MQGLTVKRVLSDFISGHWQVCRIFEKHGLDSANPKDPGVKHMIVFDVLSDNAPVGDKGDKMRLFEIFT